MKRLLLDHGILFNQGLPLLNTASKWLGHIRWEGRQI
jgi:hypothetical protein